MHALVFIAIPCMKKDKLKQNKLFDLIINQINARI